MKMKKRNTILSLLAVLFLTIGNSWGQNQLKSTIDYKTFFIPGHGAIVDIQFQYSGYSLTYFTDSISTTARVAVQSKIKNLDGVVVSEMAYVLTSPEVRDSIVDDFYDVQQFSLQPGNYTLDITLTDINSSSPSVSGEISIIVPNREGNVSISDLLIAEHARKTDEESPMTKSGYEIIPRMTNFYGEEITSLPYYVELYNTDMFGDSVIGIHQRIINENNVEMQGFSKIVRLKADPVVAYIRNMDISDLPTGSYRLEIAILDKTTLQPTPIKSSYAFDRVNDIEFYTDVTNVIVDPAFQASIADDSVFYYLASLMPIARYSDTKTILQTIKAKNLESARKYIQQFWTLTSGIKSYDSWMIYKANVMLVEKLYHTTFQDGFETDRGRVYLQYGPPNQITGRESSPSEYPYEIWQYDAITKYHNKRFVFYNTDMVNNNYRLLHSDMVGELQNKTWQQALVKRNTPNGNVDDPNGGITNSYGSNSNTYFIKPILCPVLIISTLAIYQIIK